MKTDKPIHGWLSAIEKEIRNEDIDMLREAWIEIHLDSCAERGGPNCYSRGTIKRAMREIVSKTDEEITDEVVCDTLREFPHEDHGDTVWYCPHGCHSVCVERGEGDFNDIEAKLYKALKDTVPFYKDTLKVMPQWHGNLTTALNADKALRQAERVIREYEDRKGDY